MSEYQALVPVYGQVLRTLAISKTFIVQDYREGNWDCTNVAVDDSEVQRILRVAALRMRYENNLLPDSDYHVHYVHRTWKTTENDPNSFKTYMIWVRDRNSVDNVYTLDKHPDQKY